MAADAVRHLMPENRSQHIFVDFSIDPNHFQDWALNDNFSAATCEGIDPPGICSVPRISRFKNGEFPFVTQVRPFGNGICDSMTDSVNHLDVLLIRSELPSVGEE